MAPSFLRSFSWILLCNALTRACWLGSTILLMRSLHPAGFGFLTSAWTTAALFAVTTDLGLVPLLVRESAREPGQLGAWLSLALRVKLALTLPVLALCGWVSGAGLALPDSTARWALALALATPLVDHFQAAFLAVAQVERRLDVYARHRIGYFLGTLAGWAVVVASGAGLLAVSAWYLAATVVHVAGLRLALKPAAAPAPLRAQAIDWRAAAALLASGLLALGYYRVDLWVLARVGSFEAAGLYASAYQFILLVYAIPSLAFGVLLPDLYRSAGETARASELQAQFDRTVRYLAVLGAGTGIVGMAWAEALLRLLGGERYAVAAPALALLCPMLLILPVSAAFQFLVARNRLIWRVASDVVGVLGTLGGGWWLAREQGAAGMALAASLAYALAALVAAAALAHGGGPKPWALVKSCLACSAAAAVPAVLLRQLGASLWVGVPATGLAMLALLTLAKYWTAEDRALASQLWDRWRGGAHAA